MLTILLFAPSVSVYEILAVNNCMNLTLTLSMNQVQMYIHQSNVNKGLPIGWQLSIVIFAISVTVYVIFTGKICVTLTLIFRMGHGKI